jgi:hypothetical protein
MIPRFPLDLARCLGFAFSQLKNGSPNCHFHVTGFLPFSRHDTSVFTRAPSIIGNIVAQHDFPACVQTPSLYATWTGFCRYFTAPSNSSWIYIEPDYPLYDPQHDSPLPTRPGPVPRFCPLSPGSGLPNCHFCVAGFLPISRHDTSVFTRAPSIIGDIVAHFPAPPWPGAAVLPFPAGIIGLPSVCCGISSHLPSRYSCIRLRSFDHRRASHPELFAPSLRAL